MVRRHRTPLQRWKDVPSFKHAPLARDHLLVTNAPNVVVVGLLSFCGGEDSPKSPFGKSGIILVH